MKKLSRAPISYNVAISTCEKAAKVEQRQWDRSLLKRLRLRKMRRTISSYNVAIKPYQSLSL